MMGDYRPHCTCTSRRVSEERGPSRKKQAAIIASTAAVGAAAGGLYPAIGAAGAGVALAILLPHGKQAALAAGSLIGMRLDRDVTFSLPSNEK